MKLVKGQYYTLTGAKTLSKDFVNGEGVKFPQRCLWNGAFFIVKSKAGKDAWSKIHFIIDGITKSATLEIYPYRGGFRYRKIAANGKVLNHHYQTKQGAKKGAEAERKFWENYKVVYK